MLQNGARVQPHIPAERKATDGGYLYFAWEVMMFAKQHLIPTERLKAGMVIAQTVISEQGHTLLEKGLSLTEGHIENLRNWHIRYVSVEMPDQRLAATQKFFNSYGETLNLITAAFKKVEKFNEVPLAECKELVDNYIELMMDITGVVDSLYKVKVHNEDTFTHSLHTAIITGLLGKWAGFKGVRLKELILSGLLHDIGKAQVQNKILTKPMELTGREMERVKMHSLYGYQLLADSADISEEVKLGVLQHHEREDGSGYPLGLQGADINIYAKIIAIADVYDAMSTDRAYRKKKPPFAVIDIMLGQMYNQLNPALCWILASNVRKCLIGLTVLLSDGSRGKVVLLNDVTNTRPVVQLDNGALLDLEQERNLSIVSVLEEGPIP